MGDLKLSISVGLGDCIYTWAALHAIKHKYKKIYVNTNWSILKSYRNNSPEYRKFLIDLMALVYSDPCFVLHSNQKCPHRSMVQPWGIPPALPWIPKLCKTHDKTPQEPYIVVTTKVREYRRKWLQAIHKDFIKALQELSKKYKVVLIGEREVEFNVEYKIYGDQSIYSLYNDVVSEVDVVDLTIPKLGKTSPQLDVLQKDCGLMRDAQSTITIGSGGNLALATAATKKLIGLRKDQYQFMDCIYKNTGVTTDPAHFIAQINNIGKK